MSENSKIEWTDHTFNPWEGCQKVGPGCDHCYAETRNARFGGGVAINWGPDAPRRRTSPANWRKPLHWNKQHAAFFAEHGRRQRVFCASLADVFDNAVDRAWRIDLFDLIELTPNLDWLLLTKRIGNVPSMLKSHDWCAGQKNVWLGITVVNQAEADRDIPKLLSIPAHVKFLSMEPLLERVDVGQYLTPSFPHCVAFVQGKRMEDGYCGWCGGHWSDPIHRRSTHDHIDWVIAGGESGPDARPLHPDWPRSLRDQCEAVETPFLFKQWGEFIVPEDGEQACRVCGCTWNNACSGGCHWAEKDLCSACVGCKTATRDRAVKFRNVGKRAAGRELDGRTHDEFPRGAL